MPKHEEHIITPLDYGGNWTWEDWINAVKQYFGVKHFHKEYKNNHQPLNFYF